MPKPGASRLDACEADVGTIELVDLVGLAAEECARVDADLDASADSLEVSGVRVCDHGPGIPEALRAWMGGRAGY